MTLRTSTCTSAPTRFLISALGAILLFSMAGLTTPAQAQEEEDPGERYVALTTFEVPLHVRDTVIPYMQEYVVPLQRLNPNVVTFRVLAHRWGSDASQIALYREVEEFADVDSLSVEDCGQPCEEYMKEPPEPEEGDEGYEEFQEAEQLYQEYNSDHQDQIYWAPMEAAKTEGEIHGTVGPPEEDEGEGN
ncbi:MAG: hypothetical protein BRD28_06095 [Bacteroidetes bacterium QH_10_64_37]|nr:MAG: hypothetical protein BRD28_06095 [Bacteroidetes bacterium QH_10_64_37]